MVFGYGPCVSIHVWQIDYNHWTHKALWWQIHVHYIRLLILCHSVKHNCNNNYSTSSCSWIVVTALANPHMMKSSCHFGCPKGNYVTLNLPEQIEKFGPLQAFWEVAREWFIHLIKQKQANMHWTYTFMSRSFMRFINLMCWIGQCSIWIHQKLLQSIQ